MEFVGNIAVAGYELRVGSCELGISNRFFLQSETRNPQLATRNLKLCTHRK
jgi:hypothetical protein